MDRDLRPLEIDTTHPARPVTGTQDIYRTLTESKNPLYALYQVSLAHQL